MIIKKWNDETEEVFREYQKAMWEFLLEHCDILPTGKMFVKFHTDGKTDFERRVWARWRLGYHRENVVKKESFMLELRDKYRQRLLEKQRRREAEKARHRSENILSHEVMMLKVREVAAENNKVFAKPVPVPFWKRLFSSLK